MAKPLVSDELWQLVEPLLAQVERRYRFPGRKRIDDREVVRGVWFVSRDGDPGGVPAPGWGWRVGKGGGASANTVVLVVFREAVPALVRNGTLSAGHARSLVGLPDGEKRAQEIISGLLNVRQAEHRSSNRKRDRIGGRSKDSDTIDLEGRVSNALGLKVKVLDRGKKGGEVRIEYRTLEQLDEVTRRLSRN